MLMSEWRDELKGEICDGFIVHAFTRTHRGETQLCLTGRLAEGETFALVFTDESPRFYVRRSDEIRAQRAISLGSLTGSVSVRPISLSTMDGEPCSVVEARTQSEITNSLRTLEELDVRTYEADIRLPDAFLMNHAIHGSIRVEGEWRPGKHVNRIYLNPEISPSGWSPVLSLASIDIETNPFGPEIYAVSIQFLPCSGPPTDVVLLRAPDEEPRRSEGWLEPIERRAADEGFALTVLQSEEELLRRWIDEIKRLDPDLITGWNVTGFDFERIVERLAHYGIPFRIGRSGEAGTFFAAAPGKPATVVVPGRQVLDALRIARSGPQQFPDHSLETVATEVLGRGKKIEAIGTREKLASIEEMYRNDPLSLCRYCLEDARLVNEILRETGLLELTLKRSLLIGVPLSRAWTSIAAFDFVYIEAMHRKGIVAPTLGTDSLPMLSAPGGAIISPFSGLFDNVLVFDFKSLYPSIIRTFNIDPLGYRGSIPGSSHDEAPRPDLIRAPNGACFDRERAILPSLLEELFAAREEAKRNADATGAYVYKILMNSFYGVLGASGCRFAGSDLSGAITGFGKKILYWCRDLLEKEGHHTLYGDTDSLFVESNLPRGSKDETLRDLGARLCSVVNERLAAHVGEQYGVESRLELEFEKVYVRFFIPPLRGPTAGQGDSDRSIQRGRSKGYAGYLHSLDHGGDPAIEVKGMEAVRRDWTEAAKKFQLALLRMAFEDTQVDRIAEFVRGYVARMRSGELDAELVYSKALRKSVAQYTSNSPPHVQAARLLDKLDQSGVISYLWTTRGPQPVGKTTAPIDYEHYLEKQLKPIAGAFSEALHTDLGQLFDSDGQLTLF